MLMILGASFTGLAAWLVLADAGVSPARLAVGAGRARRRRLAHAAWGSRASQGEFDFGVPQFQQMFLPLLLTHRRRLRARRHPPRARPGLGARHRARLALLAASSAPASAATAARSTTRSGGLYIVSAAGGRGRRPAARAPSAGCASRVLSGVGVAHPRPGGRVGVEPGRPPAVARPACCPTRVRAVPGRRASARPSLGRRLRHRGRPRAAAPPPPAALVAAAGLAVLVGLALPMPAPRRRRHAPTLDVEPAGATTQALRRGRRSTRADAADDARWFQAMSWQGGGLVARRDGARSAARRVRGRPSRSRSSGRCEDACCACTGAAR